MSPLHGFLPCFPVMTFYQSQTAFMFPRHGSLPWLPTMAPLHDFLSYSLHVSRHGFPSWFPFMTFHQTASMFPRHGSLPWLSTMASLHDFLSYSLHVSRHDSLSKR